MDKFDRISEYIVGMPPTQPGLRHIQGIAKVGSGIILTSTMHNHDIMIASIHSLGNTYEYKVSENLPPNYEHAGGIDVLELSDNEWIVAVPVWHNSQDSGAVIFYELSYDRQRSPAYRLSLIDNSTLILSHRTYAAGISQVDLGQGPVTVLVVVCDSKGEKLKFFKSSNYSNLSFTKICSFSPKQVAKGWSCYPNNCSLISYDNCLHLVGLRGECTLFGLKCNKNLADFYQLIVSNNNVDIKNNEKYNRFEFKVEDHVSFRWGGRVKSKKFCKKVAP